MRMLTRLVAAAAVAVIGFTGFAIAAPTVPAAEAVVFDNWAADELVFVRSNGGFTSYRVTYTTSKLGSRTATGTWSSSWTTIAPIDINGDGRDELLFYNARTGKFSIRKVTSKGQVSGAAIRQGTLGKGWTTLVGVDFHPDANDELILYNATTGAYRTYNISAKGVFGKPLVQTTIGARWTSVFGMRINAGDTRDRLVLHQSSTGKARIHTLTSKGALGTRTADENWGRWTRLVPANVDTDAQDEVVFYNSSSRRYKITDVRTTGAPRTIRSGTWSAYRMVIGLNVDPRPTTSQVAQEVLRLVNKERKARGLKPLALSSTLNKEALRWSRYQAKVDRNQCFHRPDLTVGMPAGWRLIGENVAYGYRTPAAVVQAWMRSPSHRQNILRPSFTHMGVGDATSSAGYLYWTQIFTQQR